MLKNHSPSGHYCRMCGRETTITETYHRFDQKTGEPTKIWWEDRCKDYSNYMGDDNGHYYKDKRIKI